LESNKEKRFTKFASLG